MHAYIQFCCSKDKNQQEDAMHNNEPDEKFFLKMSRIMIGN
jgi:hypothetical protein